MTSAIADPAPSRRERRRREVHERILDAALDLFERKGFSDTTALEISEAADIAEKTFYNHFPTKQHVIEELSQRSLADTRELLAEVSRYPGTTVDRLRRFFERSAVDVDDRSRTFTREVLGETVRMAQMKGLAFEHNHQLRVALRALLEQGLASGDIAPDRDLDFLSELATAAYLGILINWVVVPDYPLRDRLRELGDVFSELLLRRAAPATREEAR
jgi:AcrR family transcriptional regulator